MPRASTKAQLLRDSQENFDKLFALIDSMPLSAQEESFAYNERDCSLKDVLVHLYEWQILLLNFIRINGARSSEFIPFLPPPYNFKTYPQMNREIKQRHSHTSLELAKELLHKSHTESMELLATLDSETLFIKKHYKWCGSTSLGSYCVSSTSSHYDWAIKCIKKRVKAAQEQK